MNLCNPRHPEHFLFNGKNYVSWGGEIGGMACNGGRCDFFNEVKINRYYHTTATFPCGRTIVIRRHDSYKCCKYHERWVEICQVAQYKEARQTQPIPVLDKKNLDRLSRAFLLARKIADRGKSIYDQPTH